jgi:4-diphosphocytidyl-2-C-methyl-D-erythritol kinase
MLAFPNSKINLGLYVTGKRTDGFHNIETVFFPIPLHDILEILPCDETQSEKVEFESTGINIDCSTEKNLCVKAYHLLDADFNLPPVKIILHKVVPMGAGLGGGSADGAFTFTLLNQQFNLNLSKDVLANYAAKIGSDCPFFIYNQPMLGFGRGEILSPVEIDLKGYSLVLVKPPTSVGTAEAYKGVKLGFPEIPLLEVVKQPVSSWKNNLKNNFEVNIFPNHPEIENIKMHLYEKGAIYACMSGSGSTVFGIFRDPQHLKESFKDCFYWEGQL